MFCDSIIIIYIYIKKYIIFNRLLLMLRHESVFISRMPKKSHDNSYSSAHVYLWASFVVVFLFFLCVISSSCWTAHCLMIHVNYRALQYVLISFLLLLFLRKFPNTKKKAATTTNIKWLQTRSFDLHYPFCFIHIPLATINKCHVCALL